MNLIQELGEEYFSGMCGSSGFVYKGEVWRVRAVEDGNVYCQRISGPESGSGRYFSADDFAGFRVFAYPELGYRRLNEHLAVYLTRVQSTHRGLREQSINSELSPVSRQLALGGHTVNSGKSKLEMAMLPEYDSADKLRQLRAGEVSNVILSNAVLIEPSLSSDNEWYDVFYHQTVVGKMNGLGRFTFADPQHEAVITPLLS